MRTEGRQPTLWGCRADASPEGTEGPGAPSPDGMAPGGDAGDAGPGLLERICARENMREAYRRVKANAGAAGVDRVGVGQMHAWFSEHADELFSQLLDGTYVPSPTLRAEIPKKEKGKVRKLGIPTVADRVVQQAIAAVLTPIYEPMFHDSSYGFRPGRSAHDALHACRKACDEGYAWVVDMDLERFFDNVNHSRLIQLLSETIRDGRVISLIGRYLRAGVVEGGVLGGTEAGTPQGGPLSPLLSNVMLNELDWELDRRGHRFVRYADDCMILCRSRRAAERTLESIVRFIEGRLLLKVNREKTKVVHITRAKFLGYGFGSTKGKCWFRLHPDSYRAMKDRVRELTSRSDAIPSRERPRLLASFIRGWVAYYRLCSMKGRMAEADGWMRRRIRALFWKRRKRVRTRFRMLRRLGFGRQRALMCASCRKGCWRAAGTFLQSALTSDVLARMGYISFSGCYAAMQAG